MATLVGSRELIEIELRLLQAARSRRIIVDPRDLIRTWNPHPAQTQILSEARRFNILACGRRFGKTALGAELAKQAALKQQPVGWFSPTFKFLDEAWRDLKWILAPVVRSKSETQHRLELIGGGVIECWSLDDTNAGRSRKYGRVIIDEAAMVRNLEEAWTESIRPTLTDLQGDAWFMSTPNGYNYFHTLYERGQDPGEPQYASWQMPSRANPHLLPSELDSAQAESPPRVFAQEYEASFVDDATIIFSREWYLGQNRYDASDPTIPYRSIRRYLSWDTGFKDKETNAYTARIVGELMPDYKLYIRHVWRGRLQFPDLTAMIAQDAALYNDGKLADVLIEDKASGISALQTLRSTSPTWLAEMLQAYPPTGSKEQRAEQAAVWCRNGCVLLPNPGPEVPWLLDFENELFMCPQSEFMDQVDALSQLILWTEGILERGYWARQGKLAA